MNKTASSISPILQHRLRTALLLLCSLLITWATIRSCAISTFHPLSGIFFVMYLLLGRAYLRLEAASAAPRRERRTAFYLALLFTLFTLCADYSVLLTGLNSTLFRLGYLGIIGSGLLLLFTALLRSLFIWMHALSLEGVATPISRLYSRLPVLSFLFCLLGWLPYLLTNYPGIMTVDSLNQYGQIIGALPMSNHHPWIHTQLIRLFYQIGMAFTGDSVTGLALFTLFQMLVMAGIFSYLMDTFVKLHCRVSVCIPILLFYALLPYNAIYMVTMWKDILFSGMVLLFSTALFRFLAESRVPAFSGRAATGNMLLYLLSGFGMCLLRSNGFYAFLLCLPFLLLCLRKKLKKHLLLNILLLALVLLVKGPILQAQQVASSDLVESLSIPIQLAARVYADKEPVTPAQDTMWNRIVDTSKIPETYQDFCSDHMKNLIRQGDQAYLNAHRGDYLRLWLQFGLAHPGAYLRGYIDATKGYWYPDVPNVIGSDELIAENPYELSARPLIHNPVTIKIKELVFKLPDMVPIYGLLFSLGAMLWLSLVLAGKVFADGKSTLLLIFLPNAAIMATLLLATPVNNEFRYGYPMLLTLPLFFLCALSKKAGTAITKDSQR